MKKVFLFLLFLFPALAGQAKWYTTLEVLNGNYTGTIGKIKYYSVSCGESLKLRVDLHNVSGYVVESGISSAWYVDSVYQFTQTGVVEFSQSGLIYTNNYNKYAIQLTVPIPTAFSLNLTVHNYNSTQMENGALVYTIPENEFLNITAREINNCGARSAPVKWLINDVYYALTFTDEAISINQPGLISAVDTVHNISSTFSILLKLDVITLSNFPFPFSETSNPSLNNLRYTIVNSLGQVMEQGDFFGRNNFKNYKAPAPAATGNLFCDLF